jgi:hypothetical protein
MKKVFTKGKLKDDVANLTEQILSKEWLSYIKTTHIDSLGILDGKDIIFEFLDNNEIGCAFDHLAYILSESKTSLNSKQNEIFQEIREKLRQ